MHFQLDLTERPQAIGRGVLGEPAPGTADGERLDSSEGRVVRQLVEALLFEQLVEFEVRPRSPAGETTERPASVYRSNVDFKVGGDQYRCAAAITAFGRVRVAEGSVRRVRGDRPVDVRSLVRSLALDAETAGCLESELLQTVELCRWNHQNLAHHLEPRRALGFQVLESALIEGHPYHPCFKTRTGFSLEDHRAFGPEAGRAFQLEWLAVLRSQVRLALPSDETSFWLNELGAQTLAELSRRLQGCGGDLKSHALLPIHPWQLRALRSKLEGAIARGQVMVLGECGDQYRATQSLRTLVNVTHPEKANVKLPLDVVCTSSRRNLQPHFACTAPMLSDWLEQLVTEDPYLQVGSRVILLKEYAGMMFEPGAGQASAGHGEPSVLLAGMVGAVYRESVLGKVPPGEEAVPFTALLAEEADGRPFIADWLERHGVEAWVRQLIEVVVIPMWHLLVHHGIAFESHAQNLVLLHQGGWPTRIAARDFHEETEFVPGFLGRPELEPSFERIDPYFASVPDDDGYRMASVEALRQLFVDTVFVFNLAELSFLLERSGAYEETRFWVDVREALARYEQSGVTDPKRIERIWITEPHIVVESLLKKKILGAGRLEFFEHQVENALAC